jgi:hypothetical protein
MTRVNHRLAVASMCLVTLWIAPAVFAQSPQGRRPSAPMYDSSTEVRLTGTVEAVETVAGPGRESRDMGGLHLTLKTAAESIEVEVHLGPAAFLAEKKMTVAKGDTIEILGSRITMNDRVVLIAREIKKGEDTVTLRDGSGRPLWARSRP